MSEQVEVVLLPDTTRWVPQMVCKILQQHTHALAVVHHKTTDTARCFPGAHVITRSQSDSEIIQNLFELKPTLLIIYDCFYDEQKDPLIAMTRQLCRELHIKLLILMQKGCPFASLLQISQNVWAPENAKLSPFLQYITESKLRLYAL